MQQQCATLSGETAGVIAVNRDDVARQAGILLQQRTQQMTHLDAELTQQRQATFNMACELEQEKQKHQRAEMWGDQKTKRVQQLQLQIDTPNAQGTHVTSRIAQPQKAFILWEQSAREHSERAANTLHALSRESDEASKRQILVIACESKQQGENTLCSEIKEKNASLYSELQQAEQRATQSLALAIEPMGSSAAMGQPTPNEQTSGETFAALAKLTSDYEALQDELSDAQDRIEDLAWNAEWYNDHYEDDGFPMVLQELEGKLAQCDALLAAH